MSQNTQQEISETNHIDAENFETKNTETKKRTEMNKNAQTAKTLSISEVAELHYQWVEAMGWHNKSVLEALALISSEVGEAINECRGETPTEHFAEELADVILRTLDLARWQGIDIEDEVIKKIEKNKLRGNRGRLK